MKERLSLIIGSLRGRFKLKGILPCAGMPKFSYMYWQKRLGKGNPYQGLEKKLLEIHEQGKGYGYRRMSGGLRNYGYRINKKKLQRVMQKLCLQITSCTHGSRKYNSYDGKVGRAVSNKIRRRFNTNIPHQRTTTDTTEFKYYEIGPADHMTIHKLYLDQFISFGIARRPSSESVMLALERAMEITRDCLYRRTFHSDQE